MSDPQLLLEKCLDPPSSTTVTKATQYLKDIGACEEERTSRGRKVVPTDHGRLISTLPFSVEDASVIIHGAKNSLLYESLALVAIKAGRLQSPLCIIWRRQLQSEKSQDILACKLDENQASMNHGRV